MTQRLNQVIACEVEARVYVTRGRHCYVKNAPVPIMHLSDHWQTCCFPADFQQSSIDPIEDDQVGWSCVDTARERSWATSGTVSERPGPDSQSVAPPCWQDDLSGSCTWWLVRSRTDPWQVRPALVTLSASASLTQNQNQSQNRFQPCRKKTC